MRKSFIIEKSGQYIIDYCFEFFLIVALIRSGYVYARERADKSILENKNCVAISPADISTKQKLTIRKK